MTNVNVTVNVNVNMRGAFRTVPDRAMFLLTVDAAVR
jgi:hypothetical protein